MIRPLYERLVGSGIDFELVLVANFHSGEADPTPAIARRFAAERDRVVVIADAKQGAMGWDMRAGFAAASNDHLVVIDGDGQNPIEDVVRIHEALIETRADIAKGTRTIRYDGAWRSFTSRGYNMLFQRLFPLKGVSDVNGKPKGLTRAAYERLELTSDDWFIDAEIVIEARHLGMTIAEIPVIYGANQHRHSLVRPSTVGEFLRNFWIYRSRARSPARGGGNSSRTM